MGKTKKTNSTNPYEEARNQRLLENKRRFEELGILQMSKSLEEVTKALKKPRKPRSPRKEIGPPEITEIRRSSRERNAAVTYDEEELGFSHIINKLYEDESNGIREAKELEQKLAKAKKLKKLSKSKNDWSFNPKNTIELDTSKLRRSSRACDQVSYDEEVTDDEDDELEALMAQELSNSE